MGLWSQLLIIIWAMQRCELQVESHSEITITIRTQCTASRKPCHCTIHYYLYNTDPMAYNKKHQTSTPVVLLLVHVNNAST